MSARTRPKPAEVLSEEQRDCGLCSRQLANTGVWCNYCGWIHIRCSGLSPAERKKLGKKSAKDYHFVCPSCTLHSGSRATGLSQAMSSLAIASQTLQIVADTQDVPQNQIEREISDLPQWTAERNSGSFGTLSSTEAVDVFRSAFQTVSAWRNNLFYIPRGRVAKLFIEKLAELIQSYADSGPNARYALNAAMLMPTLLLQRSCHNSTNAVNVKNLERRMEIWTSGNIDQLLREGTIIQQQLKTASKKRKLQSTHKIFADAMQQGRVGAAIASLSENAPHGCLSPADKTTNGQTVKEALLEKHPQARAVDNNFVEIREETADDGFHAVLFDSITAARIRKCALQLRGSSGPNAADSTQWKRLLCEHGQSSGDLCNAIAALTRKLCTKYVDPDSISNLRDCRLIALDKNPGIRPIGICDVLRRLISKVALTVLKPFIRDVAGHQQLAAGHEAGCEAAIHGVRALYEEPDCEGLLLVDAKNAFNELNRGVALRNIQALCPSFAAICTNFYREPSILNISGDHILSEEGTTQGDPLAMPMFGISAMPLINRTNTNECRQVWIADDATGGGKLPAIREWWRKILLLGPGYGYFPNASKTKLLVKKDLEDQAKEIFHNTGVEIITEGTRILGSVIGDDNFVDQYMSNKVEEWVKELNLLSEIAKTEPQAALSCLTHGMLSKYTFLMRTTPNISQYLTPLQTAINSTFLTGIFGRPVSEELKTVTQMPNREGGLGIPDFSVSDSIYDNSVNICTPLFEAVVTNNANGLTIRDITIAQNNVKMAESRQKRENSKLLYDDTLNSIVDPILKRSIKLSREKGASAWLTMLPIRSEGFVINKSGFRDALALRYGLQPEHMPTKCICAKDFNVEHALSCPRGGFPIIRHNEIRDLLANVLSETCHDVAIEPQLQRVDRALTPGSNCQNGARLDVSASGVWGGRFERTYFDVRVFNPLCPSNSSISIENTYKKHENEKRRAYESRTREVEGASFCPVVLSSTGGHSPSTRALVKRLGVLLSEKLDIPKSRTTSWLRTRLSFACIRSSIMCLRGARSNCKTPIRAWDPYAMEIASALGDSVK